MQKIVTFIWLEDRVEEAMNFYTSIFKDSKIVSLDHYRNDVPGYEHILTTTGSIEIAGQLFYLLNGNTQSKLNESVSLFVNCEDQAEIDYLWENLLSGGGKTLACGWLTDKFGLSWQIVPKQMLSMLNDPDQQRSRRVMNAMMEMIKLDLPTLEKAYRGE